MAKKYKLATESGAEIENGIGTEVAVREEMRKAFSPSLHDAYEAFHAPQLAETDKLIHAGIAHQKKCRGDASDFLALYWGGCGQVKIQISEMEEWISKNEPLDRWFFIHLIEVAGEEALKIGHSRYKAEIAASKNSAPRAWVVSEWNNRVDKQQKKSEFASQYCLLVKKKYNLLVKAETIARDWLPKAKK